MLSFLQESQDGVTSEEELSETSCLIAFIHLLNDIFWKILAKRPGNPSIAPVVNPGTPISVDGDQPIIHSHVFQVLRLWI